MKKFSRIILFSLAVIFVAYSASLLVRLNLSDYKGLCIEKTVAAEEQEKQVVPNDWLDRINQSFRVLFAQGGSSLEEPVEINQVAYYKVSDPRFLSTAHVRAFLREIFSTRFMNQIGLMDQVDSTRFQNYVDWDDELYLLEGGGSFLDFSLL